MVVEVDSECEINVEDIVKVGNVSLGKPARPGLSVLPVATQAQRGSQDDHARPVQTANARAQPPPRRPVGPRSATELEDRIVKKMAGDLYDAEESQVLITLCSYKSSEEVTLQRFVAILKQFKDHSGRKLMFPDAREKKICVSTGPCWTILTK